ncbi:hypothetical protein VMT65_28015 [Nocardia sp. CDC153]|uniref:hypothetical protein n=1 Tax=unclassified Nocardia TaxID=2637762 RepID=UPI002DBE9E9C|nr:MULTISPECIES: hypothetical protein [unclassified Nocardia]MEC3915757.1 hypothetical protein [Nocardia sp. CDC160]MEC3956914.1 hypothetical protein [Nocardia sp. CDC153]
MKEPVCIDCWRRENLTFAQRLDPAFIKPGPKYRCAIHREMYEADVPGAERVDRDEAA